MEESDNIRKSFERKVYNATTHEELKAALKDFYNYYNTKMKEQEEEQEEEHSFLSNKKQEAYDFFYNNLQNLYYEKYISNKFFETLINNYENELKDATTLLEINKIQNSFINVYDDLIKNPIKRTPGIKKQEPPDHQINYTIHEPEAVRNYEELEKIISEGINTLLHKKLITKNESIDVNKYYQTLLKKSKHYEDIENAYVDFDTYYKEALQRQPHMQDAYSFLSPDIIPQITNKKESTIPSKFDIEKIKEMLKNNKYRENIMKTLPEHYMKNEITKNELIELTRMGTTESTNEIPYFVPPKEILSKKRD